MTKNDSHAEKGDDDDDGGVEESCCLWSVCRLGGRRASSFEPNGAGVAIALCKRAVAFEASCWIFLGIPPSHNMAARPDVPQGCPRGGC